MHVGFEGVNLKSKEDMQFEWDSLNMMKIGFFDNAEPNQRIRLISEINNCYPFKTQGRNTFPRNLFVLFGQTICTAPAIGHRKSWFSLNSWRPVP